jgi:hypothetical protein
MKTENIYTVDYFIAKFESIPEDKWLESDLYVNGRSCALGHCGHRINAETVNEETSALVSLFIKIFRNPHTPGVFEPVWGVNDGFDNRYQQSTPKQRILAALWDIKAAQQPEVKERIVYVTIDAAIRDLQSLPLIEQ